MANTVKVKKFPLPDPVAFNDSGIEPDALLIP